MAISEGRSGRGALLPLRMSQLAGSRGGSLVIFVGKRILCMVPIVFFVILITFVLMHLAPGSPWDRTGGRQLSQAVMNNLNIKYGLDKPETEQFKLYVWNVIHFDFGLSYQYEGKSVVTLIGGGWPYTTTIGFLAVLLIVPIAISLGAVAAFRQNTRLEYITMGFATFAASFPNFVIGALMVVVFSDVLSWWRSHHETTR